VETGGDSSGSDSSGSDSSGSGSSSSGSSDIASSGLLDILRTLAPLICLVGFLSYFAWFLLSPMRHGMLDQEGEPWLRFETILLLSQTPLGDYLSIWTGGGNAPLSVIDRWPIVLTAGFIIGVSYAAGWLLMDLLGLSRRLHPLETSLFSIGVGLNFLSLLTLILGLLGLLHFPAVFVVILLTVVGAAAARARGGFPKRELEREVIVEESASGVNLPLAAKSIDSRMDVFGRSSVYLLRCSLFGVECCRLGTLTFGSITCRCPRSGISTDASHRCRTIFMETCRLVLNCTRC